MSVLLIIVCVYGIIHMIAFWVQDYLFFHPEKLVKTFQFEYPVEFEEIQLVGVDNSLVDCLYFPCCDSKKVVFYFKGNTRSIKGWAKFSKDFLKNNHSFFIIDYPGFGKSTGPLEENTIYKNAQIAYDWLKSKYTEDNIVIYGRSLGAGFAGYITMKNDPAMLILDSPFYNFKKLAKYYTRILFLRWILKYDVPLNEFLAKTRCPIHIIHGDRDITIPLKQGLKLTKVDPGRIKLHVIKNGRHNNLPKLEQYHKLLAELLNPDN